MRQCVFHDLKPGDVVHAHGTRLRVLDVKRNAAGNPGVATLRTLVTWQDLSDPVVTYATPWTSGLSVDVPALFDVESSECWCGELATYRQSVDPSVTPGTYARTVDGITEHWQDVCEQHVTASYERLD